MTQARKPGPQPMKAGQKRTHKFQVPVNAGERREVEQLARKAGVPVAVYIRQKALDRPDGV